MNVSWDRLADGVFRTRLPFLDVTVGLVAGSSDCLLIDTGSTLVEAQAIGADVVELAIQPVRHVLLTHNHFDHVLGFPVFDGARVYCAPPVADTVTAGKEHLRADAIRHGADAADVDAALDALREPDCKLWETVVDLGGRTVAISHPGRGHTDHDLIAVIASADTPVVFCGDLVEESGDPSIEDDSDLDAWPATLDRVLAAGGDDAVYVPGHGATVDADFIRVQRRWLTGQK
nr:MBL fold metallo-hydrolase [Mycolicibacterium komanii]CRL66784.1 Zn-dependent hydrolase [Mycolicibacterium komanii]